MKKLLIGLLLVASSAAAEFPTAQKTEIASKLIKSMERGKLAMYNLGTHARYEIGVSIPENIATHRKLLEGWEKSCDALAYLLDLDGRYALPRTQVVADAILKLDQSVTSYQSAVAPLQALVAQCSVSCSLLTAAQSRLSEAIVNLQGFNRTLDYTIDPKVDEVLQFPGVTRASAPLIPPHGDWDTLGKAARSSARSAANVLKKRLDALALNESLAARKTHTNHDPGSAMFISALAMGLFGGIEFEHTKTHVDQIFSGMTTTRTRHFARGMLTIEMMLATVWDDSQEDINGRSHHRGIGYLWTQMCKDDLKVLRLHYAQGTAELAVIDGLEWMCEGWKDTDSTAFNQLVFRDFNAVGPPPIDCEKAGCSTPTCQECPLCPGFGMVLLDGVTAQCVGVQP